MYIILGALGEQGKAILYYLCNAPSKEPRDIVAVDVAPKLPPHLENTSGLHNVRYMQYQHAAYSPKGYFGYFDGWLHGHTGDNVTVINCLPTEFILDITKECIGRGWNVIDLGGVTEITLEQMKLNDWAEQQGVTVVPDWGLAPGIVSSKAAELVHTEHNLIGLRIYCGGIPKWPEPPLYYIKVFYMDGVRKEYSGVAREITDGESIAYPTLTGREYIYVPGFGVLEAARTSGGISVAVEHLDIPNLCYKTLRYPGHWDYVERYIMSQKDPTSILEEMTEPVSSDNPDVILLSFHIDYVDGDVNIVEYFWEYNYKHEISAMAQATGFTVAALARKVHDSEIAVGVVGSHEIDASQIIALARELPGQYCETPIAP